MSANMKCSGYAKQRPGELKYGSVPGISPHFTLELLKIRTGTDITFIPYKGAAPVINDALGEAQIFVSFQRAAEARARQPRPASVATLTRPRVRFKQFRSAPKTPLRDLR